MPTRGMCEAFMSEGRELIQLFSVYNTVYDHDWFWGYDGECRNLSFYEKENIEYTRKFTPIRQAIILLCAAMNNEL